MEEQLISFQTAKLAKEKGYILNTPNVESSFPTQSLLQKWLREVHKLNVIVNLTHGFKNVHYYSIIYDCNIHRPKELNLYDVNNYIKTYEQALEKGLQEALKLIK